MARKKRLTKAVKLEAISGSGGLLVDIAKAVGVHRATVRAWIQADPDIAAAIDQEREATTDKAERAIIKAIEKGSLNASKYWLRTIGKHRGFTTRTEVEGHVHATGQVVITIPDNNREANATFDATDPPAKITTASSG